MTYDRMDGRCCCLKLTVPFQYQRLNELTCVTGQARPCEAVRVAIDDFPPIEVTADECGRFCLSNPHRLASGAHRVCVSDRRGKCRICRDFCTIVDAANFGVRLIDARMGRTFRTIDVDVTITGASGPATVYYLLLRPGSPAPTAEEIMRYTDAPRLINGTSATGQFDIVVDPTQSTYTWALTGLDHPNSPAGTTGVVDGYRYDVYLHIVFCDGTSGILSHPSAAMGMPYASGRGTADDPFTIRDLSPDELAMYPDLIADNPLNRPGVDENARMLENIERLITLYEETNGLYGLSDSMRLNYLMTSDIDLGGYAPAYEGAGWEPIGDIDGFINDRKLDEHLFSGVFSGGGHTISNLSMTPTATADYFVRYRGLFGGVDEGTIENLTLSGVTIDALVSAPGQGQLGSFISIARIPTLSRLTLYDAALNGDAEQGAPDAVDIGGFVAEITEGGSVSDIVGQRIAISSPRQSANALGGFVAYTTKYDGYDRYERVALTDLSIRGSAQMGGLAGLMFYGANLISDVTIDRITLDAPDGDSGGMIGRLYLFSATGDVTIERCQAIAVSTAPASEGASIGGLIGIVRENPFVFFPSNDVFPAKAAVEVAGWPTVVIDRSGARTVNLTANSDSGGLIGTLLIDRAEAVGRTFVTRCRADGAVNAVAGNAGGLIGQARFAQVDQCFAQVTCTASSGNDGGLIGAAYTLTLTNSYATGSVIGGDIGGGVVGWADDSTITHTYGAGSVTAIVAAGGIAGSAQSTTIENNLVLGGAMTAIVAHRVLGIAAGSVTLLNNYALNAVTPVPGAPDPNGVDGGTITSAQITSTMVALGFDTATIWNTATVASLNRPTLLQNPEG